MHLKASFFFSTFLELLIKNFIVIVIIITITIVNNSITYFSKVIKIYKNANAKIRGR